MKHLLSLSGTCPAAVVLPYRSMLLVPRNETCEWTGDSIASFAGDAADMPAGIVAALLFAAVAVVILAAVVFRLCRLLRRQRRRIRWLEHRASKRILLFRNLLDLGYVYGGSPQIFLEKFMDKVNVRQLKACELVDLSDRRYAHLKEDEIVLCVLLDNGFTPGELCTIFNLKNVGSLYVKYHRVKVKLRRAERDAGAVESDRKGMERNGTDGADARKVGR